MSIFQVIFKTIAISSLLFQQIPQITSQRDSTEDASCHSKAIQDDLPLFHPDARSWSMDKTIFFIDTSCNGGLNRRQTCSVISAANANPNWQIIVLFAGPVPSQCLDSPQLLRMNKNVKYYRMHVADFAKDTPLEDLLATNTLIGSKYPVTHLSYVLKFLVLYKFGGVYLNTDMLVVKSFDNMPRNWVARENDHEMGVAAVGVTRDGVGSQFVNASVDIIKKMYNPEQFEDHDVMFKTLQHVCFAQNLSEMTESTCQWMKIFPSRYFYPIALMDWAQLFDASAVVNDLVYKNEKIYTFNTWHKYSKHHQIDKNSPYGGLAQYHCPNVMFTDAENSQKYLMKSREPNAIEYFHEDFNLEGGLQEHDLRRYSEKGSTKSLIVKRRSCYPIRTESQDVRQTP